MPDLADPLIRFGASLAAVALLVLLVWRLGLGAARSVLDEGRAQETANFAFPGFAKAEVLLLEEGSAALAKGDGGVLAHVAFHGAHPVARLVSRAVDLGEGRFELALSGSMTKTLITLPNGAAGSTWAAHLRRLG